MSASKDLWKAIDKVLSDYKIEDNSVVSSWVLVTENVASDGYTWIQEVRSSELPPWRRLGLLYYVIQEDGNDAEPT